MICAKMQIVSCKHFLTKSITLVRTSAFDLQISERTFSEKIKHNAIIFIALIISSRISECDWFVKVMEIGFVPPSLLSDSISLHKASRRCNNLKKFDKYKRWSE